MVSSRHENLWLEFEHAHTGMVAGPMTGRIVAGMITGPMPNIDVTPYRADRFRVGRRPLHRLRFDCGPHPSNAFQVSNRSLIVDIAGIERRAGLQQHNLAGFLGNGPVLDTVRHDDELSRPDDLSFLIAKLLSQAARNHKEELIFFIMAVPDELALELD